MKIIIDADHITYRAAASCSPTKAKPFQESLTDAIWRAESMVSQIFHDLNSTDAEFYISGEGNWRYDIYPDYKANRRDIPKPMWLEEVREHLIVQYKAEIVNGKEVDDMCGIRLTQEGDNAVCASLDKDMKTVPGNHYSWETRGANWIKPAMKTLVSPYDALRNFYAQVITGDQADNIPGFDGKMRSTIPKFVQKLIDPLQEMQDEVDMYEYCRSVYEDKAMVDRNAMVLYIQRKEDDKWQPPSLHQ